MTKKNRLRS